MGGDGYAGGRTRAGAAGLGQQERCPGGGVGRVRGVVQRVGCVRDLTMGPAAWVWGGTAAAALGATQGRRHGAAAGRAYQESTWYWVKKVARNKKNLLFFYKFFKE